MMRGDPGLAGPIPGIGPANHIYIGDFRLMQPDPTLTQILAQYGWMGLFVVVLADKVIPPLIKVFSKKSLDDVEHKRSLESRSVAALEKIADATQINQTLTAQIKALVEIMNNRMENHEAESATILRGIEILLDRVGRQNTGRRSKQQPPTP